jgi:hypothetical protein
MKVGGGGGTRIEKGSTAGRWAVASAAWCPTSMVALTSVINFAAWSAPLLLQPSSSHPARSAAMVQPSGILLTLIRSGL